MENLTKPDLEEIMGVLEDAANQERNLRLSIDADSTKKWKDKSILREKKTRDALRKIARLRADFSKKQQIT